MNQSMAARTPAQRSHLEIAVVGRGGYAPARSVGIAFLKSFVGTPSDLKQPAAHEWVKHEWVKSLAHDFTHHSVTYHRKFLAELIPADWRRFPSSSI